jgi:hypothetical protein
MADVPLTQLQQELLRLFFGLPESKGFVLAGGAGLLATGLSERPTQDVDLFGGDPGTGVVAAADALEAACRERGWTTQRMQDSETFRRLVVRSGDDELLVDLAVDSPPMGAPSITAFGPVYPPEELAARKILALFDRAAARDFVDVHVLSARFDLDHLVDVAGQLDEGFDTRVLVDMLATIGRFTDQDLAELGSDPTALRTFVDRWRRELESGLD